MKVNVYETVEVSDQQRIMIAQVLDEELTKRKASRAEMKTFVWDQGSEWASSLTQIWAERFGPAAMGAGASQLVEDETEDADLLGLLGSEDEDGDGPADEEDEPDLDDLL